MPEIEPFRGIRYDSSKVETGKVIAPPYDVIDTEQRAVLAARDPANCVRLILPEGEGDDKYQIAAKTLAGWLEDGTLVRDDRPSIYRYHQVFQVPAIADRTFTRKGFIAAVRLYPFDAGVILPHERTLKGPKIDRLKLMGATHSHLSQIFGLYSDPSLRSDELLRKVEARTPDLEGTTDDGAIHRVWQVPERELIGELQHLMAAMNIYIADGHHRYETMLALREQLAAEHGELGYKSSAQYATMFLSNMSDEGLVVLPTHRLLHSIPDFDFESMCERARPWFEETRVVNGAIDSLALRTALAERGGQAPCFAAIRPKDDDAYLFELGGAANLAAAGLTGSRSLLELDVTLLHELLLDRILGVDRAAQEARTNIRYVDDTDEALERVRGGEGQVCFIMNPTRLSQIRAVADAHEFMPQKSTFFYPKIASGLVFTPIDPDADLY